MSVMAKVACRRGGGGYALVGRSYADFPSIMALALFACCCGVLVGSFVHSPALIPHSKQSWADGRFQNGCSEEHRSSDSCRAQASSFQFPRNLVGVIRMEDSIGDVGEEGSDKGASNCASAGGISFTWGDVDGGINRGEFVRMLAGIGIATPLLSATTGGVAPADAAPLERVRLGSPILTESILLDLLPISGRGAQTLRNIQAEIEKATILRTLYRRANATTTPGSVVEQLQVPVPVWDRVQSVAEGSLEMLIEERSDLDPVFRSMDTAEVQIRRAKYGEEVLSETKAALKRMAIAAKARRPPLVLAAQEDALLGLGRIGELLVSGFPFSIKAGEQYDSIPRLLGRATVELTMRREPEEPRQKAKVLGNITMVVDGYSSPVSAGNFIDLINRGFYNELPIQFDEVLEEAMVGGENNRTLPTIVAGSYRDGFVDPSTGNLRRLPLEVLRVERNGNAPVYGAARNTKVFTKSPPVQTFRIPGAIAMNHPPLDGNGGSSEFFWLRDENLEKEGFLMNDSVENLDGRYAIFSYVVGNRKLLGRLRDGDVIEKVTVTYGEDNLIRAKPTSFTDLLLNGGGQDDDE